MSLENFPDFEEQEDHPDERWLVSYADMMTLLFGLFVLLFSMATMDQDDAAKVRDSTQKQFGGEREPTAVIEEDEEAPTDMIPRAQYDEILDLIAEKEAIALELTSRIEELEASVINLTEENENFSKQAAVSVKPKEDTSALRTQLRNSAMKIARLESELESFTKDNTTDDLRAHIKDLERQLKGKSSDKERFERLNSQISAMRSKHDEVKTRYRSLNARNKELMAELNDYKSNSARRAKESEKEVSRLRSQLQLASQRNQDLINKAKSFADKKNSQSQELSNQVKKLERNLASVGSLEDQLKSLQSQLGQISQEKKSLEETNKNLAKNNSELSEKVRKLDEKAKAGQHKQSFLAFFINWSSREHDIDLTIEDPRGKKFDFKNRKHSGSPGHFTLDTRRGPGVEIWQSDNLVPGRYKATYFFYNQYGNVAPASVRGTIFTPKGSIELDPVELDLTKNRKHELTFDVDKEGTVRILSK